MRSAVARCVLSALVLLAGACHLGWESRTSREVLAPAQGPAGTAPSRELVVQPPHDWHEYPRGGDLIATHDGVFLQNIRIERIRLGHPAQEIAGMFPAAALSSKQWPMRTAKHLSASLASSASPAEVGAAVAASLKEDPALSELEAGEVVPRIVAGFAGFEVDLAFRIVPRGPGDLEWGFYAWSAFDVQRRRPAYRSVCCGFVEGDWLYLVSYTGARRHYFEKDRATFDAFLESIRVR
jgi:hypothetical protein